MIHLEGPSPEVFSLKVVKSLIYLVGIRRKTKIVHNISTADLVKEIK
jgi:hypothetical protein